MPPRVPIDAILGLSTEFGDGRLRYLLRVSAAGVGGKPISPEERSDFLGYLSKSCMFKATLLDSGDFEIGQTPMSSLRVETNSGGEPSSLVLNDSEPFSPKQWRAFASWHPKWSCHAASN